jgi:tRNA (cytidine32/guanosine34-2'-O)-methyltransferase
VDLLYAQLKIFFEHVHVAKPRSSRASSVEAFIVCLNFQPPEGFKASLEEPLGVGQRLGEMLEKEKEAGKSMGQETRAKEDDIQDIKVEDLTTMEERQKRLRWIAPFIACGDLSAFDSDASYKLPDDHVSLDPVQPPTAPPYKRAIELRKALGGHYGPTTKS